MKTTFQINGINEYIEFLDKKASEIDIVARSALAEIGEILKADMQARVTVISGEHSQNIIDHLAIKTPSGEGHYNYIQVGIIHDKAFTDAETAKQAVAVEFGSVHNAAMPFVRPAIYANRDRVMSIIRSKLQAAGMVD